jgi:ABC-type Fe3+-hydroxamate transport system substrate-binding protein
MAKKDKIIAAGVEITIISDDKNDYISLTDMAGYKDELEARVVVSNWMSTHFTLDFLGIWEQIYNPNFNRMEFHTLKTQQYCHYANANIA